jgi:hypothetical protein
MKVYLRPHHDERELLEFVEGLDMEGFVKALATFAETMSRVAAVIVQWWEELPPEVKELLEELEVDTET